MGLSSQHILVVLLVVAVVFGASKLPQVGENMGKAIRNFKKGVKELDSDVEDITPPKNIENKDNHKKSE